MAKGLAPIFFTTCGVVVSGIIGYSFIAPNEDAISASQPIAVVEQKPEQASKEVLAIASIQKEANPEPAKPSKLQERGKALLKTKPNETTPKVETEAKTTIEQQFLIKPKFTLLRVEKDGSAVIAGEGPVEQKIELIDGTEVISETKSSAIGEFVFVLDKPLASGEHKLNLRAISRDGKIERSSSFAFVDVPKPKTIGDVIVLLAEAGKASQVLQNPKIAATEIKQNETKNKIKKTKINKDTPEKAVISSSAKTSISLADLEKVQIKRLKNKRAKEKEALLKKTEAEVTAVAPIVVEEPASVLIEAADVEIGKIFIAGKGKSGSSVNIYLENELLGVTEVAENGAFLFEGKKDIAAGRYDVRADLTHGGGSKVLARAEVKLIHEPKVAIIDNTSKKPVVKKDVEPKQVTNNQNTQTSAVSAKNVNTPATKENELNQVTLKGIANETVNGTSNNAVDELAEPSDIKEPVKEIESGSAVIIRRGDSLWTVARRNYGAGIRYTTIFDANRDQVRNPALIYPGQVLMVPDDKKDDG